MTSSSVRQPDVESSSSSPKRIYGIWNHNPEGQAGPEPFFTAGTWDQAYNVMIRCIEANIKKHPDWGLANKVVSENMLQVLDSAGKRLLCYEIDAMVQTDANAIDSSNYTRLSKVYTEEYYILFIDRYPDAPDQKQSFFVRGFENRDEALRAMNTSARAFTSNDKGQLEKDEDSALLRGADGNLEWKYWVEPGISCSCLQRSENIQKLVCANENCPFQWFHLECVGLDRMPPEHVEWLCSYCRPSQWKHTRSMSTEESEIEFGSWDLVERTG